MTALSALHTPPNSSKSLLALGQIYNSMAALRCHASPVISRRHYDLPLSPRSLTVVTIQCHLPHLLSFCYCDCCKEHEIQSHEHLSSRRIDQAKIEIVLPGYQC